MIQRNSSNATRNSPTESSKNVSHMHASLYSHPLLPPHIPSRCAYSNFDLSWEGLPRYFNERNALLRNKLFGNESSNILISPSSNGILYICTKFHGNIFNCLNGLILHLYKISTRDIPYSHKEKKIYHSCALHIALCLQEVSWNNFNRTGTVSRWTYGEWIRFPN